MLRMTGPGMLGFQLARPDGLPDVDTLRARMVGLLGDHGAPPLTSLAVDERQALFFSLALTLARAEYHAQRLDQVVAALGQRRKAAGATVSLDAFSHYVLFEASAALGAVRLGVDELIHIAARLRGVSSKEIYDKWPAEAVIRTGFAKRPDFNLPEVLSFRSRLAWYEEMNDYRNVLHHRGWRDQIGGYYPRDSELPEAADHAQNVMLVPDRASLLGKTRPHQWTYSEKRRIEGVTEDAVRGFHEVLDEICTSHWGGALPMPGTVPQDQHANLLVVLVRPTLLIVCGHVLLPMFTSPEKAQQFGGYPSTADMHLQEVSPTTIGVEEPVFNFSLVGLEEALGAVRLTGDLIVAVDP
jgi:hypothetical protein